MGAHAAASHHDVKAEVRRYIIVFLALLIFTVITVAISYLHLSHTAAIVLALIVATIKASLVVLFFMHLIDEEKIIYLFLSFTVLFFFAILFLPSIEHHDVPEGTIHLIETSPDQPAAHH